MYRIKRVSIKKSIWSQVFYELRIYLFFFKYTFLFLRSFQLLQYWFKFLVYVKIWLDVLGLQLWIEPIWYFWKHLGLRHVRKISTLTESVFRKVLIYQNRVVIILFCESWLFYHTIVRLCLSSHLRVGPRLQLLPAGGNFNRHLMFKAVRVSCFAKVVPWSAWWRHWASLVRIFKFNDRSLLGRSIF